MRSRSVLKRRKKIEEKKNGTTKQQIFSLQMRKMVSPLATHICAFLFRMRNIIPFQNSNSNDPIDTKVEHYSVHLNNNTENSNKRRKIE